MRAGFFDLITARDNYRAALDESGVNRSLSLPLSPSLPLSLSLDRSLSFFFLLCIRSHCCGVMHARSLLDRYIEVFLIMLSPFCPHITQYLWNEIGKVTCVTLRCSLFRVVQRADRVHHVMRCDVMGTMCAM